MKSYINTKEYSCLRLHQPFNKRIWLMKRERTHSTAHHFSFGERFDERVMNAYFIDNKHIASLNHQFIGFSPFIKSAGEEMRKQYNTHNSVCSSRATRFRELPNLARRVGQLGELSWATRNFELGDLTIRVARLVFCTRIRRRLLRNGKAIAY